MRKDTLDNLRDAVGQLLRVYDACHGVVPEPYKAGLEQLKDAYRLAFTFNPLHELTPAQEAEANARHMALAAQYDKALVDAMADKRDEELRRAD